MCSISASVPILSTSEPDVVVTGVVPVLVVTVDDNDNDEIDDVDIDFEEGENAVTDAATNKVTIVDDSTNFIFIFIVFCIVLFFCAFVLTILELGLFDLKRQISRCS